MTILLIPETDSGFDLQFGEELDHPLGSMFTATSDEEEFGDFAAVDRVTDLEAESLFLVEPVDFLPSGHFRRQVRRTNGKNATLIEVLQRLRNSDSGQPAEWWKSLDEFLEANRLRIRREQTDE